MLMEEHYLTWLWLWLRQQELANEWHLNRAFFTWFTSLRIVFFFFDFSLGSHSHQTVMFSTVRMCRFLIYASDNMIRIVCLLPSFLILFFALSLSLCLFLLCLYQIQLRARMCSEKTTNYKQSKLIIRRIIIKETRINKVHGRIKRFDYFLFIGFMAESVDIASVTCFDWIMSSMCLDDVSWSWLAFSRLRRRC